MNELIKKIYSIEEIPYIPLGYNTKVNEPNKTSVTGINFIVNTSKDGINSYIAQINFVCTFRKSMNKWFTVKSSKKSNMEDALKDALNNYEKSNIKYFSIVRPLKE